MLPTVFHQLFILGVMVLTGFIAERFKILPERIQKGLSEIILQITLPASIVASADISLGGSASRMIFDVVVMALLYYSLVLFLSAKGAALISRNKNRGKIAALSITFANVAFMGFPVTYALYGREGLFFASIFTIFYNIFLFTAGVNILDPHSQKSFFMALINPRNIATAIMLLLFSFQVKIPAPLQDSILMIGNTSTPLSMFIIGAMLSRSSWKNLIADKSLYFISLVRLLVIPLALMLILKLISYENLLIIKVMIVMASMPVGSMVAMVAEKYGCEPQYSTVSIIQSMFLFVFTFPFIMLLTDILFA